MTRGWQDYWDWANDKPAKQLGAVKDVLEAAGVSFSDLRSCEDDPPDCEAFIDGQCSAIEHSELLCQENLQKNLRSASRSAVPVAGVSVAPTTSPCRFSIKACPM
jgi:hypothetical protein